MTLVQRVLHTPPALKARVNLNRQTLEMSTPRSRLKLHISRPCLLNVDTKYLRPKE